LPDVIDALGSLCDYSEQAPEALHYQTEIRMEKFKRREPNDSIETFNNARLQYSLELQSEFVYLYDLGLLTA
jgi:hypothetical protein